MRRIRRHVVVDDLRFGRLVWIGFRIVVFVDLVDVRDVKSAIPVGDAGRHLHALRDGFDGPLTALVFDCVNVRRQERTDIKGTVLAPGHLPRLRNIAGPQLDLEAWRQLDRSEELL